MSISSRLNQLSQLQSLVLEDEQDRDSTARKESRSMAPWGFPAGGGKAANKNGKKKPNEQLFGTQETEHSTQDAVQDEVEGMSELEKPPKAKLDRSPNLQLVPIDTSDRIVRRTPDDCEYVSAHRGLLTAGSGYFAESFNSVPLAYENYSYGTPSEDGIIISFKDCQSWNNPDIEVLKAYTQWLYTHIVSVPAENKFDFLARTYIFGEKVVHHAFCNAVMNAFVDLHIRTQKTSFEPMVTLIYNFTTCASPMRKLLTDMYAFNMDDDPGLEDVLGELPKAFLVDVVARMTRMRKVDWEGWKAHLEGESYHWAIEEPEAEV